MGEYSVQDFLYNSYIAVGGTLTQEQFETAWKSFPNTSGFEIRFANSFEELGDQYFTTYLKNILLFILQVLQKMYICGKNEEVDK